LIQIIFAVETVFVHYILHSAGASKIALSQLINFIGRFELGDILLR